MAQLNGPRRARESPISKFWAEKFFRGSENRKSGFEGLISYFASFLMASGTVHKEHMSRQSWVLQGHPAACHKLSDEVGQGCTVTSAFKKRT